MPIVWKINGFENGGTELNLLGCGSLEVLFLLLFRGGQNSQSRGRSERETTPFLFVNSLTILNERDTGFSTTSGDPI